MSAFTIKTLIHWVVNFIIFRCRRTVKENYRETEKAVLDSILGKGYDKRIRPSGRNFTGMFFCYIYHMAPKSMLQLDCLGSYTNNRKELARFFIFLNLNIG